MKQVVRIIAICFLSVNVGLYCPPNDGHSPRSGSNASQGPLLWQLAAKKQTKTDRVHVHSPRPNTQEDPDPLQGPASSFMGKPLVWRIAHLNATNPDALVQQGLRASPQKPKRGIVISSQPAPAVVTLNNKPVASPAEKRDVPLAGPGEYRVPGLTLRGLAKKRGSGSAGVAQPGDRRGFRGGPVLRKKTSDQPLAAIPEEQNKESENSKLNLEVVGAKAPVAVEEAVDGVDYRLPASARKKVEKRQQALESVQDAIQESDRVLGNKLIQGMDVPR